MRALRFGDIVFTRMVDLNGVNEKVRPAVVLTQDEVLQRGGPVIVAAISTTAALTDPLPEAHILLPWHRNKHPKTGLTKKAAVVCSWVMRVDRENVEGFSGKVPGALLKRIAEMTSEVARRLLGEP